MQREMGMRVERLQIMVRHGPIVLEPEELAELEQIRERVRRRQEYEQSPEFQQEKEEAQKRQEHTRHLNRIELTPEGARPTRIEHGAQVSQRIGQDIQEGTGIWKVQDMHMWLEKERRQLQERQNLMRYQGREFNIELMLRLNQEYVKEILGQNRPERFKEIAQEREREMSRQNQEFQQMMEEGQNEEVIRDPIPRREDIGILQQIEQQQPQQQQGQQIGQPPIPIIPRMPLEPLEPQIHERLRRLEDERLEREGNNNDNPDRRNPIPRREDIGL